MHTKFFLNICAIDRKKIDDLNKAQIEIFFHRYSINNLKHLMYQINKQTINCKCQACYETGRNDELSGSSTSGFLCSFVRKWEILLDAYKISYVFIKSEDLIEDDIVSESKDPIMGPYLPTAHTFLVHYGETDMWLNVVYGRPLVRNDNNPQSEPRKRLSEFFKYACCLVLCFIDFTFHLFFAACLKICRSSYWIPLILRPRRRRLTRNPLWLGRPASHFLAWTIRAQVT